MDRTTVASAEDWPVEKCRVCGFADRWSEFHSTAVLTCGNCGSMILTTKPNRDRMLAASGRLALQSQDPEAKPMIGPHPFGPSKAP